MELGGLNGLLNQVLMGQMYAIKKTERNNDTARNGFNLRLLINRVNLHNKTLWLDATSLLELDKWRKHVDA